MKTLLQSVMNAIAFPLLVGASLIRAEANPCVTIRGEKRVTFERLPFLRMGLLFRV